MNESDKPALEKKQKHDHLDQEPRDALTEDLKSVSNDVDLSDATDAIKIVGLEEIPQTTDQIKHLQKRISELEFELSVVKKRLRRETELCSCIMLNFVRYRVAKAGNSTDEIMLEMEQYRAENAEDDAETKLEQTQLDEFGIQQK
ncbi:hypothetical protein E4U42_006634 [Claviceps africana]|uniref:DUF4094 domain-containing protein n=1 Tax=Claviceps africana TaxID=83212 RepID=A0A8K0NEW4_9HYPO|nr:hypothetical protein E4U42_006634 [Claviceps africana]